VRYDGETFVEGLPTSRMRYYSNKLILCPGREKVFGAQNSPASDAFNMPVYRSADGLWSIPTPVR